MIPVCWDEQDLGCKNPIKDDFTVDQLQSKLGNKSQVELHGPYSQYYGLVPFQVILSSKEIIC
jgi:hypothetical protein